MCCLWATGAQNTACHSTFYGFLLCFLCLPSSQGEDAAIKILQDKILLNVWMHVHAHASGTISSGHGVLKYSDAIPDAVSRPDSDSAGFPDVNTDNIDLNKTNLPLRNSVLTPFHSYSLPASSLSPSVSFFATLPGGGAWLTDGQE